MHCLYTLLVELTHKLFCKFNGDGDTLNCKTGASVALVEKDFISLEARVKMLCCIRH